MARTLVLVVMLLLLLLHARFSSPDKISVVCSPQDLDALRVIRVNVSPLPSVFVIPFSLNSSWVGEDCCSWPGIGCDSASHRVAQLRLVGYAVGGTILEHVCNLSMLQVLALEVLLDVQGSSHVLPGGVIPDCVGRLQHMTSLGLVFLELSGAIPASLAELLNLQYLNLRMNELSGPIPAFLSQLVNLEIRLSDNQLEIGQPPASLFILPQLQTLYLSSCRISSLPCASLLQNMTSLEYLDLSHNNLTADSLHCLARAPLQLTYLDLSRNPFNSFLPSHLTCLADDQGDAQLFLDLSSCNLTGSIPPMFLASKGMGALYSLDLSRNHLVGTLPSMFGNLSNLKDLDLSHNGFTGLLPTILGQCTSLRSLHLGDNHLEGEIPSELGKLGYLQTLALHDNNLRGTVPNLWNCAWLELLDLGQNNLDGTLEDLGLSNLSNLRVLALGSNSMNGSIPSSLATFSQALQVIDLSQNSFSGGIPQNLNNLTAFRIPARSNAALASAITFGGGTLYEEIRLNTKGNPLDYPYILVTMVSLNLGRNSLSGDIPSSLGDLSQMVFLNLSQNSFTGQIPPSLSNLSAANLETLDLSNNSLHGRIPPGLSRLTALGTFNVSYNQLSGPIPQGGQFNTFTNASYMGNEGLCGDIPIHKPCTPAPSMPAPPAPPEAKSTSLMSLIDDWVSIPAVCVGYVVTFILTVWFFNFSAFSYRARK